MIRILILSAFLLTQSLASDALRPNIILFMVDDYDKPETSVYGGNVLTPNLDRLAREGMVFHETHVTSTVCTPSRYTFLTGRYAGSSHSHVYLEECPLGQQGLPAFNVGLEEDNHNVAAVLSEAGYATGYVGKYHVHDGAHESAGPHQIDKQTPWSPEVDQQLFENEKAQREIIQQRGFGWARNIYWGNMLKSFKGHNPEWTIEAALEFVEANQDQPFYLHYCTTLLHGPNGEWYRSLVEKETMSGEGTLDEPVGLVDRESVLTRIEEAGLTEDEVGYLWMDDTLGLLLDKLDELGIAENTIIAFVSDHGSEKKGSLFRSRGTEIPCIVRWPAVIEAGTETEQMVQNTDFVPTWFEVARAETPADYNMDGVSILPLLQDPEQSVREFVYAEQGPARSIKTRDWSYIALRYTEEQIASLEGRGRGAKSLLGLSGGISRARDRHPGALDSDQLYHLTSDPDEQTNLASEPGQAERLQSMRRMLTTILEQFPDRPYGEFVPGSNATDQESADAALRILRNYED